MQPIEYLKHPAAAGLFDAAIVYRKRETTALRLPAPGEVGAELVTYKADPGSASGYRVEMVDTIESVDVVARNSGAALGVDASGRPVYNEWLIPRSVVERNYGAEVLAELTQDFQERSKKATLKAMELTEALAEAFGAPKSGALAIKVDWSDQPMFAHVGDFLTDQGYSVSKGDMGNYAPVEVCIDPARVPEKLKARASASSPWVAVPSAARSRM